MSISLSDTALLIYNQAVSKSKSVFDALHFGPSHIVWEDDNLDDHSIKFCISEIENPMYCDIDKEDLEVVKWSLEQLLKIPEKDRYSDLEDDNIIDIEEILKHLDFSNVSEMSIDEVAKIIKDAADKLDPVTIEIESE